MSFISNDLRDTHTWKQKNTHRQKHKYIHRQKPLCVCVCVPYICVLISQQRLVVTQPFLNHSGYFVELYGCNFTLCLYQPFLKLIHLFIYLSIKPNILLSVYLYTRICWSFHNWKSFINESLTHIHSDILSTSKMTAII